MDTNLNEIKDQPETPVNFKKEQQGDHFKSFRWIVGGLIAFVILMVTFWAGTIVGFRQAAFNYSWGENYQQNFGGPPIHGIPNPFAAQGLMNSHGVTGSVIKTDGNSIVIKGNDNVEKTVVVSDTTSIRGGQDDFKVSDLKVGDIIVVIGSPNSSGQIDAKFIRIFRAASQSMQEYGNPPAGSININIQ